MWVLCARRIQFEFVVVRPELSSKLPANAWMALPRMGRRTATGQTDGVSAGNGEWADL